MNADWAPGGRQPSEQTNRFGLWVRQKMAADTIAIYYYYSARKLILILPSHVMHFNISSSNRHVQRGDLLSVLQVSVTNDTVETERQHRDNDKTHLMVMIRSVVASRDLSISTWAVDMSRIALMLQPPRPITRLMVLAGTSSRFDLNTYIQARYNDTLSSTTQINMT